jgi:hypothetical protein
MPMLNRTSSTGFERESVIMSLDIGDIIWKP